MACARRACVHPLGARPRRRRSRIRVARRARAGGDLPDYDALMSMASRLFAEAGDERSNAVQIMTLHRAKGLQFDAVILPGLDLGTGNGDPPLLRWKVREHEGASTLVLAPMRARFGARAEPDPVYAWLGRLDAAEEAAELGRLLYVGATRARQRLHLTAVASCDTDRPEWKRPARGTALERVWDAIAGRLPPSVSPTETTANTAANDAGRQELVRLPGDWRLPPLPDRLPVATSALPPRRFAGIRLGRRGGGRDRNGFAPIAGADCSRGTRGLGRAPPAAGARPHPCRTGQRGDRAGSARARRAARCRGHRPHARGSARALAVRSRRMPMHAANGRWPARTRDGSCTSSSTAASSRAAVATSSTSRPARTSAAIATTFLRQEFDRYRPQLTRYARIVRALDSRPLRIALYHPLVEGGWQEHDDWPDDGLR